MIDYVHLRVLRANCSHLRQTLQPHPSPRQRHFRRSARNIRGLRAVVRGDDFLSTCDLKTKRANFVKGMDSNVQRDRRTDVQTILADHTG